jgi:hypothetical protein
MTSENRRDSRADRRGHDRGPPTNCYERRKRPERRLPQVEDADISAGEFASLFSRYSVAHDDHASDVLERNRYL